MSYLTTPKLDYKIKKILEKFELPLLNLLEAAFEFGSILLSVGTDKDCHSSKVLNLSLHSIIFHIPNL
jgi:hypothetical protein